MQYVLSYKSYQGIDKLVKKLRTDGFSLLHSLDDIPNLKEKIIGICIDFDSKTVFQLGITSMAFWSNSKRRPLYVEEIIKDYDRLITKKDFNYYTQLVEESFNDKDRPIGKVLRLCPDSPRK